MTPFAIRTIQGSDVIINPGAIESIATSNTGCAIYMNSGTVWHTSETVDTLTDRLDAWAGSAQ